MSEPAHNSAQKHEWNLSVIAKYVFVGLSTPLIYVSLYWVFEQVPGFIDGWSSFLSYSIAVIYQFYMHSKLTFSIKPSLEAFKKFIATIAIGALLSFLLTAYLPLYFENSNAITAAIIIIVTPIFNFIMFSNWVFVRR